MNEKLNIHLDDIKHRKQNDFNRLIGTIEQIEKQHQNFSDLLSPLYSMILANSDIDDYLDSDGQQDQLNLKDFLGALIRKLEGIHQLATKGVTFLYCIEPIKTPSRVSSTLAFVVCELVNNAVKYGISKKEQPTFKLNVICNGRKVIFSFSDNGDDEHFVEKFVCSESLGWSIVSRLLASISSSPKMSRKDGFSVIDFSFKLKN